MCGNFGEVLVPFGFVRSDDFPELPADFVAASKLIGTEDRAEQNARKFGLHHRSVFALLEVLNEVALLSNDYRELVNTRSSADHLGSVAVLDVPLPNIAEQLTLMQLIAHPRE